MFKFFFTIFIAACSTVSPPSVGTKPSGAANSTAVNFGEPDLKVELTRLSLFEKKTRQASIKITDKEEMGHGSGSYVRYNGISLIFTAAHVVEGSDKLYVTDTRGGKVEADVLYSDLDMDFAVLKPLSELQVKPVKIKIPKKSDESLITRNVIFSGYPGHHSLMTVEGKIAGFERGAIMVHGYAWLGSSGSCVFDESGNFIGVIRALDVGMFRVPQLTEDMIWVSPFSSIDWNAVDNSIKNTN